MKERYLHFDLLKGIAILLVILGHIFYLTNPDPYTNSIFYNLLVSLHMPLFIFISGYFSAKELNLSLGGIKKYWQGKALRLLLPLLFLPYLMNWIDFGFNPALPITQYIGKYWFTFVLFELFVIFYLFRLAFTLLKHLFPKLTGGGQSELAYFVLTAVLINYLDVILNKLGVSLPNSLSIYKIIWLYKYLVLGYLIARNNWVKRLLQDERFGAFSVFSYVVLLYVEYVWYSWGEPFAKGIPITIFGITSFYYVAYNLSKKETKTNQLLGYLGRESLPIYLTHYFFLPYLPWLSKFLSETISNKTQIIVWEFWIGLFGIVLTLVPTLIVIRIVKTNRYLAFLLYGEKI